MNRLRTRQDLQQPTGVWTNGFGYDAARRLTHVTSPAGAFNYLLPGTRPSSLVSRLSLPNGSYITNTYDNVARLTGTHLKNSSHSTLNSHAYTYNTGNQRTQQTFADASTHGYTYDNIGQLKRADSSINSEDKGYAYDAAWNLNYRTNSAGTDSFSVDGKNQLTAVNSYTDTYDSSGNLTLHDLNWGDDTTEFLYDGENRLRNATYYYLGSPAVNLSFQYDGLGRLRLRTSYDHIYDTTEVTRYIYDGWRVIQERDDSNTPTVSYTRGTDLSGTLEGAGGIGGLLARSDGYSSGTFTTNNFYHADGNGNITYMVNSSQTLAASYRYDAFGNLLSSSGSLAGANKYRFSSKEWVDIDPWTQSIPGIYYYGYRFYVPSLQRWPNRDPLGDLGSPVYTRDSTVYSIIREPVEMWQSANLFSFVLNRPTDFIDPWGLAGQLCTDKNCDKKKCPAKNLPEEGWEEKRDKGEDPWEDIPDPGKCADSDGVATPKGVLKIPNNCTCTIKCNADGSPKNLSCVCEPLWPWPRPPKPKDRFPPSPF